MTSLVEIGSVVLEREMKKCEKFSKRQTDRGWTVNRQSEKCLFELALSSGELKKITGFNLVSGI